MSMRNWIVAVLAGSIAFAGIGCSCGDKVEIVDGDTDTDTDTDTDVDTDTDTDTDADTDTDTDTDSDECANAADCEARFGAAPCGAWECNSGECDVACPGCTDADRDGYGPEDPECAGPDCDDDDDSVFDSVAPQACYTGPAGTEGEGTCQAGVESCDAGVWTPCVGQVVPSGEACNDEDDDCDGGTDEDLGDFTCGIGACERTVPACGAGGVVGVCVAAAPGGPDNDCDGEDEDCDGAIDEHCIRNCVWVDGRWGGAENGTAAQPYNTIQEGIDAADPDAGQFVCVVQGPNCGSTYTYVEDLDMLDGVSVYGGYESGSNTRCGNFNTRIDVTRAQGIVFDDGISSTTVLDQFTILRENRATSAAITVDGATDVLLSNLKIPDNVGGALQNSYGVDLVNGAEATITRSSIYAGSGSNDSIGVRSVASTPTIIANCRDLDAFGRCDDYCGGGSDNSIRGRFNDGAAARSFAVYLEDSPNTVIESSTMCGSNADTGAEIFVHGDSDGILIRASHVNSWGGANHSHGIWMEDCNDGAPWIVDNHTIEAGGDFGRTLVDGIRSIGDCHPVIDSNLLISGGGEGGTSGAHAIHCGASGAGASECVVLGNRRIQGSQWGFPPEAVGVKCDDGSCMRIAGNLIDGIRGVNTYGVWLDASGAFVDDNDILGGCPRGGRAYGVYADDAWARIQNNRIGGGVCLPGDARGGVEFRGLHVIPAAGVNELDVHSNVIDAAGEAGVACTGFGVVLEAGGAVGPKTVFRNNIILGGACPTNTYVVYEANVDSDPRIFESNNLDPRDSPTDLYLDADTAGLDTAAAVNALVDTIVSGTLDRDSIFVSYPTNLHIQAGSPCNGAGTPTGAPAVDMDGEVRDAVSPDIGADEVP